MVLAENGPSVQVQPSSNAQLLGDQNVDSALSPEITETVLEAADDGCTSAPAFRCMVYDGNESGLELAALLRVEMCSWHAENRGQR